MPRRHFPSGSITLPHSLQQSPIKGPTAPKHSPQFSQHPLSSGTTLPQAPPRQSGNPWHAPQIDPHASPTTPVIGAHASRHG
eukprot:30308-Pelagococcus_subviridis.AAC.14